MPTPNTRRGCHFQQSRFLALVSNYDEYSKALSIAENAEGAGAVQYLKTMDSISTKLQEIKTSWQQLYASLGIENVIKFVLDTVNKILKTLNNYDIKSVIGIALSGFISIKNLSSLIFKTGEQKLKTLIDSYQNLKSQVEKGITVEVDTTKAEQRIENLKRKAQEPITVSTQQGAEQVFTNKANGFTPRDILSVVPEYSAQEINDNFNTSFTAEDWQKLKDGLQNGSIDLSLSDDKLKEQFLKTLHPAFDSAAETIKTDGKNAGNALQKTGDFIKKHGATVAMALQGVGTALTAASLALNSKSSDNYEGNKIMSGTGSILSGAGTGLMFGLKTGNPYIAVAAAIAGGVLSGGLGQIFDGLDVSFEERRKMLESEYTELNRAKTEAFGEETSLKNSIDTYKELEAAQYDSVEAAQEYQTHMNTMAEQYPELIDTYDSAGNAIIDLEAAEKALAEARAKTSQATVDALRNELKQKENDKKEAKEVQDEINKEVNHTNYTGQYGFNYDGLTQIPKELYDDIKKLNIENNPYTIQKTRKNIWGKETATYYEVDKSIPNGIESFYKGVLEVLNNPENALFEDYYNAFVKSGYFSYIEKSILDEDYRTTNPLKNVSQQEFINNDSIKRAAYALLNTYGEDFGIDVEHLDFDDVFAFWDAFQTLIKAVDGTVDELNTAYTDAGEALAKGDIRASLDQAAIGDTDVFETVSDYGTFMSQIGAEMVEAMLGNIDLDKAVDPDSEYYSDYLEAKEEAVQALLKINDENWEAAAEVYDNFAYYTSEDSLKEDLKSAGITEKKSQDAFVSLYGEQAKKTRERAAKAIQESQSVGQLYKYFFDGIKNNYAPELPIALADSFINFINILDDFTEEGMEQRVKVLNDTVGGVYKHIGHLSSPKANEAAASIIEKVQWNDAESINEAIEAFEDFDTSSFSTDDVERWNAIFYDLNRAKDSILFNVETEFNLAIDSFKKAGEKYDDIRKAAESGMEIDDVTSFKAFAEAKSSFDGTFDEFATYDKNLEKWVFTNRGLTAIMDAVNTDLEEDRENAEKSYIALGKAVTFLQTNGMGNIPYYEITDPLIAQQVEQLVADWNNLTAAEQTSYNGFNDYLDKVYTAEENAYNAHIATFDAYKNTYSELAIQNYNWASRINANNASNNLKLDYLTKTSLTAEDIAKFDSFQEKTSGEEGGLLGSGAIQFNETTGQYDVIDFDAYMEAIDASLMKGTQEYAEAYAAWVDSQIEKANWQIEGIEGDLDALMGAKKGDKLNLSYLSSFVGEETLSAIGLTVENGFAEVGDTIDFDTLIKELEGAKKTELEPAIIQLKDNLVSLFDSWSSLINDGFEGTLSFEDADALKTRFGLKDTDFTQTEEGLKISLNTAYQLVGELQKTDAIAGRMAAKALTESLQKSNEELNDIFKVEKRIVELNEEIANTSTEGKRKKELEGELAIVKEIHKELKEASDSYNFMGRDLPSGFDDPLSAWQGVGTAFDILNGDDFKKNRMGFADFYNMITFMGDDVLKAAGIFTEDTQTASSLISAAAKALVNVDGETFVDLSKLGTDFNLGAEGMKDGLSKGIKTLAQNQIDMLDAEIMLLETVVKTQEAFDGISGDDGIIDLGEIEFFKTNYDDREEGQKILTDFMTQYFGNIQIGDFKLSDILNDSNVYNTLDQTSQDFIKELLNTVNEFLQEADYDDTGALINDNVLQDIINAVFEKCGLDPITFNLDPLAEKVEFTTSGNFFNLLNEKFGNLLTDSQKSQITSAMEEAIKADPNKTFTWSEIINSYFPEDVDTNAIKTRLLADLGLNNGIETEIVPTVNEETEGSNGEDLALTAEVSVSEESKTQVETWFDKLVEKFKNIQISFTTTSSKKKEKNGSSLSGEETPTVSTDIFTTVSSGVNQVLESVRGFITLLENTKLTNISTSIEKLGAAAENGVSRVDRIIAAFKRIPYSKTISLLYKITVNTTSGTGEIINVNGKKATGNTTSGPIAAKGNVALSKGTLMGELGPELVVSNGRYFTVGNNGAEFVDLADDAIVFNHLQTKRLLSSGTSTRGTPITNEKKATAFASGNAMASAEAALSELKNIRDMWQALLDASSKDLGTKAGSGGGGGGGGGGNNDNAGYEYDLERWYNMLRQIAKLEQQITYEQTKRENMVSGYNYVDSLEKELNLLEKQLKVEKQLASLQYDYYLKRMEDVNKSAYSKIFTYDDQGLMQYVDGKNRGLDALATLQATDENGVLKMSAKQQLNYITKTLGVSASDLKYKSDGSEAETDADKVQVFFDNVDNLMSELDDLYDSYHEHAEKIEDLTTSQNEILQEYVDNQRSLEDKLLQAIEDREQEIIDKLTDQKEALEEASQSYIDGLSDALSKEQDLYNKNQTNEETARLQRRLAILQRSGGTASEIKSLQDQINSRLQDAYFQTQQDQIDAIQEASNNQLEKLQTQIDLMTETLEYQKENGLLWNEVYQMMNQWTPEQMLQFIEQYTKSYRENSSLENTESSKESLKEAEIWAAKRDKDSRDTAWSNYYANANYSDSIKKANADKAQEAFNSAYASGGLAAGEIAANKVFSDAAMVQEGNATTSSPAATETEPETKIKGKGKVKTKGSNLNVRKGPGTKYGIIGKYKNKASVVLTGYKNGWYQVDYNGKTGYVSSNYISTGDKKKLPAFASGGLVDFTGPAWVDGTKNKPEAFLSAEDTAMLKSKIFGNGNNSLKSLVAAFEEITNGSRDYSTVNNSGITIENATVNIQSGVISNDYDAKRAGEMALEEMVKIARKTTNRVVSR